MTTKQPENKEVNRKRIHKLDNSLQDEMAVFFHNLHFNWFMTFTSRSVMTLASARRIAESVQEFVFKQDSTAVFFWAAEPFALKSGEVSHVNDSNEGFYVKGKSQTRYHFHGLLRHNEMLHTLMYLDKWYRKRYGICQFKPIERDKNGKDKTGLIAWGASVYCAKYINKGINRSAKSDYDLYFGHNSNDITHRHGTSDYQAMQVKTKQLIKKQNNEVKY